MDDIEFALREGSEDDIHLLSVHHRKMFEEIWAKKGGSIDIPAGEEIEQAYAGKLRVELPAGLCRAWIVEKEGEVAASGAITIVSLVPTPMDLSSRVAYLHSVYTEPEMRGRNLAARIVKAAIDFCRKSGIKRVILNASEAGRPVYERIGFTSYPEMMRFVIE